jgi:hypothetical protein
VRRSVGGRDRGRLPGRSRRRLDRVQFRRILGRRRDVIAGPARALQVVGHFARLADAELEVVVGLPRHPWLPRALLVFPVDHLAGQPVGVVGKSQLDPPHQIAAPALEFLALSMPRKKRDCDQAERPYDQTRTAAPHDRLHDRSS